ncbi:L-ascorbate oxidase [Glycine soja]
MFTCKDLISMARPNPQGSYQCGLIKPSRTIMLANSGPYINGKQRYAVNGVSYNALDTPLKLVDYFNIPRVFYFGSIPTYPNGGNNAYLQTSIMGDNFHEFMEILFQNWGRLCARAVDNKDSRVHYNLRDAVARCTTQVYPRSWTAIYMSLDNMRMWNKRSENWGRQYFGQ